MIILASASRAILARNVYINTIKQPNQYKKFTDVKSRGFKSTQNSLLFTSKAKNLFFNNLKQTTTKNSTSKAWGSFRLFGHLAGGANTAPKKPKTEMSSMEVIKKLLQFVWPKNNTKVKVRVCIAMGLLVGSKLLNVSVPFIFKEIVDFLNKNGKLKDFGDSVQDKLIITMIALVVGYGAARAGSSLFAELRSAIFASVAQSSVTQLATNVFRHLHRLDLNFHLNRQTGALSKAIDRGTRGISFILSALVFNVVPTAFEVLLVSGILYSQFGIKVYFSCLCFLFMRGILL